MTQTLTPELLRQIMRCPADRAAECFPAMVSAMRQFDVSTPARIACFLTQVKWESGGLVYFAELATGDAYEGRADLGNNYSGDGRRFKGSGPIQVTGRSNFIAAQEALRNAGIAIDILDNPDLARTVKYGFWISTWWWYAHGGNDVAERTPLSYASLCCGRLVNRGNSNSQYQAQDEAERIDAFNHVRSFGDLALPGTVTDPTPPPVPVPAPQPVEVDDMYSDDDRKRDKAAADTAVQTAKDLNSLKATVTTLKNDVAGLKSSAAAAPADSILFTNYNGGVGIADLASHTWRGVGSLSQLATMGRVPRYKNLAKLTAAQVVDLFGKQV